MLLSDTISHASALLAKSAGIGLSVWAVRYKAGCDYKLSTAATCVRWAIVAIGYLLAVSLPTGRLRVVAGFIGLAFLCWPNFAYHLTKLFVKWPTTTGQIIHAAPSDDVVVLSYAFHVGQQSFGGNTRAKCSESAPEYKCVRPVLAIRPSDAAH